MKYYAGEGLFRTERLERTAQYWEMEFQNSQYQWCQCTMNTNTYHLRGQTTALTKHWHIETPHTAFVRDMIQELRKKRNFENGECIKDDTKDVNIFCDRTVTYADQASLWAIKRIWVTHSGSQYWIFHIRIALSRKQYICVTISDWKSSSESCSCFRKIMNIVTSTLS